METVIGIEASPFLEEVPEYKKLFEEELPFLAKEGLIYVYASQYLASQAKKLLDEVGFLEAEHELLIFDQGDDGVYFADYGFESGGYFFLMKKMVFAFVLKGKDEQSMEMARYQLEEHLIFTYNENKREIYFTSHYDDELVAGIAEAYNVKHIVLDLDKETEKL